MSNEPVLSICGEYPSDFVKIDIGSDPNFVFVNDPKFEITNVYDLDGNVASVNSFLECEHYVTGGWDVIPLQRSEYFYYDVLQIFAIACVLMGVLFQKFKKRIFNE